MRQVIRTVTTELVEMETDNDGYVLSVDGESWVSCIHCDKGLPEDSAWMTPGEDSEPMCGPCAVEYVLYCERQGA